MSGARAGERIDHPWLRKLLDVSEGRLDPRKLLHIYITDPVSLRIYDKKVPDRRFLPNVGPDLTPETLPSLSKRKAVRRLIGSFFQEFSDATVLGKGLSERL